MKQVPAADVVQIQNQDLCENFGQFGNKLMELMSQFCNNSSCNHIDYTLCTLRYHLFCVVGL